MRLARSGCFDRNGCGGVEVGLETCQKGCEGAGRRGSALLMKPPAYFF